MTNVNASGVAGETPCCVLGDSVRLEQVMRNSLTNAMKFSPKTSRIEVVVTNALGKVRTSVSDSGIGIRRERESNSRAPAQVLAGTWVPTPIP